MPAAANPHNGYLGRFVAAFTAEPNNRQQSVSRLTSTPGLGLQTLYGKGTSRGAAPSPYWWVL